MAENIGIFFSAHDNYSEAVKSMLKVNRQFCKNTEELQQRLDALSKKKVEFKFEFDAAKKKLAEAQKEYQKLANDQNKAALMSAQLDFDNVKRNFDLVSKSVQGASKEMEEYSGVLSKTDNRASRSTMSKLAGAGLTQMVGSSLSDALSSGISSMFGDSMGDSINSMLSSTVSGIAMGSVAGPIGAAVGGAVGLVAGGIQAATQRFQKDDDAFKSYVQGQYEGQTEQINSDVQSGTSIAASREQSLVSFTTLFGDRDVAAGYLEQVKEMANRTPFLFDDLTAMSKSLKTYGFSLEEMIPSMTKIGDAGAALGMSAQDMTNVATYLGRMRQTGKTYMEYLNPMVERGIPVWDYFEKYLQNENNQYGSKKEIQEAISKGQVDGAEAAKAIFQGLEDDYTGSMAAQSKTMLGLQSTLEGLRQEVQNAGGEGYNTIRQPELEQQIAMYEGDTGDGLRNAYNMIGQWKASLDNLKDQMERDALSAVMTGTVSEVFQNDDAKKVLQELSSEYNELIEKQKNISLALEMAPIGSDTYKELQEQYEQLGAEAGGILAKTKALAENEYNSSEGARLELETQTQTIQGIRENAALHKEYWDTGMRLGEEFTKGLASVTKTGIRAALGPDATQEDAKAYANSIYMQAYSLPFVKRSETDAPDTTNVSDVVSTYLNDGKGHAYGLRRVPYDNYPAMLHEGERVLTAREARSLDSLEHSMTASTKRFESDSRRESRPGYAYGLQYVPYDNFPAMLHEGERVLTASENRRQNNAGAITVTITGNTFNVRNNDDVDAIAKKIAAEVAAAAKITN